MRSGLFNSLLTHYLFTNHIYIYIYIYIKLKNLLGLICHKKPTNSLTIKRMSYKVNFSRLLLLLQDQLQYQSKRALSTQLFIHIWKEKGFIHVFFQRHEWKVKCKQPLPGIERGLPCPFLTIIIVTTHMLLHIHKCVHLYVYIVIYVRVCVLHKYLLMLMCVYRYLYKNH